jgi:hypothetical protein
MMRKEEEEVVANITNTLKGIPKGGQTEVQVHPMSRNIGGLEWMS